MSMDTHRHGQRVTCLPLEML